MFYIIQLPCSFINMFRNYDQYCYNVYLKNWLTYICLSIILYKFVDHNLLKDNKKKRSSIAKMPHKSAPLKKEKLRL